jgi:hypothetical protein
MGLDQNFFKTKNYNQEPISYFRKFRELQEFVSNIIEEDVGNSTFYRMGKEELIKIRTFLVNNYDKYWGFEVPESNKKQKLSLALLHALGAFTYYIEKDIPLYYWSCW